jgi:large subunit ribosomal protein L18e
MSILKCNPIIHDTALLAKKRYKKEKVGIWKTISDILEKSDRCEVTVNISRITRYLENGNIALVPGKVLGSGKINKAITVAAISFTSQAKRKINKNGGKCLHLREIIQGKYKKSKLTIIG